MAMWGDNDKHGRVARYKVPVEERHFLHVLRNHRLISKCHFFLRSWNDFVFVVEFVGFLPLQSVVLPC